MIKAKDLTRQCFQAISIQWNMVSENGTDLNRTEAGVQTKDKQTTDKDTKHLVEQFEDELTYEQLTCCVFTELFDCVEYTFRKECNDFAFEELKKIHSLIIPYHYKNCSTDKRTKLCDLALRGKIGVQLDDFPQTIDGSHTLVQYLTLVFVSNIISLINYI